MTREQRIGWDEKVGRGWDELPVPVSVPKKENKINMIQGDEVGRDKGGCVYTPYPSGTGPSPCNPVKTSKYRRDLIAARRRVYHVPPNPCEKGREKTNLHQYRVTGKDKWVLSRYLSPGFSTFVEFSPVQSGVRRTGQWFYSTDLFSAKDTRNWGSAEKVAGTFRTNDTFTRIAAHLRCLASTPLGAGATIVPIRSWCQPVFCPETNRTTKSCEVKGRWGCSPVVGSRKKGKGRRVKVTQNLPTPFLGGVVKSLVQQSHKEEKNG